MQESEPASGRVDAGAPRYLRLATYNIQAAIGSNRNRHFLTHGWRYVMPHGQSLPNLNRIAEVLAHCDFVALQEADAGSFRTRYINQTHYLAEVGGFPNWRSHIIRDMGQLAQHSNSFLSRISPDAVEETQLPASRHGRGVLAVHLSMQGRPLTMLITHLSLSRYSRMRQIRFLSRMINLQPAVVLMGDLNCEPDSPEYEYLLQHTNLLPVLNSQSTFPSWKPRRRLDHILGSRNLILDEMYVIPAVLSDHRPVTARVRFR